MLLLLLQQNMLANVYVSPRDCSSAINVCKKLFSDSRVHNDEELVEAQHRASFMEALVRIHDCHIWHRHFRIRALSSYDIQLSRVYNHHYNSSTTPKDFRVQSPRQESGTCKRRVLQGLGFKRVEFRFQANKGNTPSKGTREGKRKGLESTQKTTPKSAKPEMGKPNNIGPKPIISSTKQVVQGDGWKTWKNTKPRSGLSCCCNCRSQDSGGMNFLNNHKQLFAYRMNIKWKEEVFHSLSSTMSC